VRGSIIKRGTTYSVVLDLGRGPDGKRVRRWHSGYRTKKDAERARTELLAQVDQGSYVEPSRLTLAVFLLEQWLPGLAGQVRPTTLHSYRTNLERYVLRRVGHVTLQRLTPAHLNGLYGVLLAAGGKDGRPLSARTVQAIHMTVRKALGDATRWGLVARNVAAMASPPKPRRADMRTWTAAELRAFLEHVAGERLAALWMLAASTGMRRGELLGLRWTDVDLDLARVAVRQTLVQAGREVVVSEPKTSRGRRSIALDPAPSRRCERGERRRRPSGWRGAPPGRTQAWCSPARTGRRSIPSGYRTPSRGGSAGRVCRPSAFTTCGTRMLRWGWPPACRSRSCPSGSGTRAARSPPTLTSTSRPRWRSRPPQPSPGWCSDREVVSRAQAAGQRYGHAPDGPAR
jgi:integrase